MNIQHLLPKTTMTAAVAAGISYIAAEQLTWNRIISLVKVPTPMAAAKFAGAALISHEIYDSLIATQKETSNRKKTVIQLTMGGVILYGLQTYFNPDKSIRTFAILSVILALSKWVTKLVPETNYGAMTRNVIGNLPKSLGAAGATWLIAKQAGYDPKIMFITTLFQSMVFYASTPLDVIKPEGFNYVVRAAATLGLTMAYRSAFDITTGLYEPFVKASLISGLALAGFEFLENRLA